MCRHRFTRERDCARRSKMFWKDEAQQSAFQPHQRDFVVLYLENLRQHHAQIQGSHSWPEHGTQGEKMLWKNNFFHHRGIIVWSHNEARTTINCFETNHNSTALEAPLGTS